MAEAILARAIGQSGIRGRVCADSAGAFAFEGERAAAHAVAAMAERGLDISAHRAKRVSGELAERADIILAMTRAQAIQVEAMFPAAAGKVYTLGDFAGGMGDVPDPYGGSMEEYRACAAQIETAVGGIVSRLEGELR